MYTVIMLGTLISGSIVGFFVMLLFIMFVVNPLVDKLDR